MGFCISNQLIWFSSKSVICDPPDTADAETVASSKFGSASNSSKHSNEFCGIHPQKRERGLHRVVHGEANGKATRGGQEKSVRVRDRALTARLQ